MKWLLLLGGIVLAGALLARRAASASPQTSALHPPLTAPQGESVIQGPQVSHALPPSVLQAVADAASYNAARSSPPPTVAAAPSGPVDHIQVYALPPYDPNRAYLPNIWILPSQFPAWADALSKYFPDEKTPAVQATSLATIFATWGPDGNGTPGHAPTPHKWF